MSSCNSNVASIDSHNIRKCKRGTPGTVAKEPVLRIGKESFKQTEADSSLDLSHHLLKKGRRRSLTTGSRSSKRQKIMPTRYDASVKTTWTSYEKIKNENIKNETGNQEAIQSSRTKRKKSQIERYVPSVKSTWTSNDKMKKVNDTDLAEKRKQEDEALLAEVMRKSLVEHSKVLNAKKVGKVMRMGVGNSGKRRAKDQSAMKRESRQRVQPVRYNPNVNTTTTFFDRENNLLDESLAFAKALELSITCT